MTSAPLTNQTCSQSAQSFHFATPAIVCKQNQNRDVQEKQQNRKSFIHKYVRGKKFPIHTPLVLQITKSSKGTREIRKDVVKNEGCAHNELNQSAKRDARNGTDKTYIDQHEYQQCRCKQKNVHFNTHCKTVVHTSYGPFPHLLVVQCEYHDGKVKKHHRNAIVEHSKHKQGMHSFGNAQKNTYPNRKKSTSDLVVNGENHSTGQDVESKKHELSRSNVRTVSARDPSKYTVNPNKSTRIYQWSSLTS